MLLTIRVAHNRVLARQLQRLLGVASNEQEVELLAQFDALAEREGGALGTALRGLRGFIERVDQSYALYDRDMALASRSLEISSAELLDANAQVRADMLVQQRALGHLRQAVRQLALRAGLAEVRGDDPGLEALSERLGTLVASNEAAQRALQSSEAKFRALTDLSTDWYWEQDADLRFVSTAGRTADRGGLAPDLHIGKHRWALAHTTPVSTTWEAHRAALEARETFHDLLLRREAAGGTSHFIEVSGAPVYDADGRFDGYQGIARDVTERVNAEVALRRAKQEADDASAAKSRFLANVSHEIRTPMNGLLGMADLMQDEPMPPAQRERLRLMRASGASLLAIINDILDVSKIEAGKLELEWIPFELRDSLEQLIGVFGSQARAKGLRFEVALDLPAHSRLTGDPLRLAQVLSNLLSNAVKFTERGQVALRATLTADGTPTASSARLRVEVQDSGEGIAEAIADTLFKPFTQADAATTRRYGGTGLGLAIAKRLAELMGGRVGLQSEVGRGSCFWLELPFTLATEDVADSQAAELEVGRWAGLQVLLVEDNEVNAIVARQHLERFGLQVRTAENGAIALDALADQRFDIVLMDCQMPVMDGYEAVRRWREREAGAAQRTPVIAVTANTMTGDRERNLAAGFDDHLGKPFARADLHSTLCRWLKPAHAA